MKPAEQQPAVVVAKLGTAVERVEPVGRLRTLAEQHVAGHADGSEVRPDPAAHLGCDGGQGERDAPSALDHAIDQ